MYVLCFSLWDFDYFIFCFDGSIIVGGVRWIYLRDLGEWYDNVDDIKFIEKVKLYFDGYM